jgi:hypothetical protein
MQARPKIHLTHKVYHWYNLAQADMRIFTLVFALAQVAQDFALAKFFHWRTAHSAVVFSIQISFFLKKCYKRPHELFGSQNDLANKSSSVVF